MAASTSIGSPRVSRAVSTTVPKIGKFYKRSVVYQYDDVLKNWWGFGPYPYFYMNPIARYTK